MAACVSGFIKFGWLVMVCIENFFGRAILRNFYSLNSFENLWLVPKIVKQEIATFQKFLIWTPNFRGFLFYETKSKTGLIFFVGYSQSVDSRVFDVPKFRKSWINIFVRNSWPQFSSEKDKLVKNCKKQRQIM